MRKAYLNIAVALSLGIASVACTAETITIATGQKGLTYNAVYGANLAGALGEFGNDTNIIPTKGSLENLDKVAAGEAQLGFTQADAYQFWRNTHGNEAQKVDIVGELPKECIFVAVKDSGRINSEGDIKAGVKIAVGEPTSGSYASWQYLQMLEPNYAKAETYAKGGLRSLSKVATGEYDAFLWVAAAGKTNKFLDAVTQKGSGLKVIDMNGWHVNDRLPNGQAVYEKESVPVEAGMIFDTSAKVPCTKTLVVANTDAGDDLLETVSGILLKNQSRIVSSK